MRASHGSVRGPQAMVSTCVNAVEQTDYKAVAPELTYSARQEPLPTGAFTVAVGAPEPAGPRDAKGVMRSTRLGMSASPPTPDVWLRHS